MFDNILNNTCININKGNIVPSSLNFLIHLPISFSFNLIKHYRYR